MTDTLSLFEIAIDAPPAERGAVARCTEALAALAARAADIRRSVIAIDSDEVRLEVHLRNGDTLLEQAPCAAGGPELHRTLRELAARVVAELGDGPRRSAAVDTEPPPCVWYG